MPDAAKGRTASHAPELISGTLSLENDDIEFRVVPLKFLDLYAF